MFGLFKKKNNDREVTRNPDVLFSSDINTAEIKVHELKLHDKADLIPIDQVLTTTFEQAPTDVLRFSDGAVKQIWKEDKVYYESSNGLKEHPLTDRTNSVLDFGGILHMKSGAKYAIRDRIIIGIGIHQDIVKCYQKIAKKNIERKFGKASKIEEYYEEIDGQLWSITYFYESRNMVVNFSEPDKEISFINIGLFPYSRTSTK